MEPFIVLGVLISIFIMIPILIGRNINGKWPFQKK